MKATLRFGALVLASLLAACGGGGDAPPATNQPPGTNPPPTNPPPVSEPDPVTSVPAPVYAEQVRADAFNRLNEIRQAAGLGLLAQHAYVDQAAQAHANYLAQHNQIGHIESSSLAGWSGDTPPDRVQAAGYGSNTTYEVVAAASMTGAGFVDNLASTPYHRGAMLGYRPVHAGVGYAKFSALSGYNLTIDLSHNATNYQGAPGTQAAIWPANGATGIGRLMAPETPNPIPENGSARAGYPASVQVHESRTLTVDSFTITGPGGAPVDVKVLDYATDPNLVALNMRFFAAALPRAQLAAGTTYSVSFRGRIDGISYSRDWTFTTTTD
jgi:uncharacterized protein YkwD